MAPACTCPIRDGTLNDIRCVVSLLGMLSQASYVSVDMYRMSGISSDRASHDFAFFHPNVCSRFRVLVVVQRIPMTSLRSRRQQLAPLAASSVTHEPTHKQINFMPGHDSWDVFDEHVSEEPGYGNPANKNRWSTRVQAFLSTTARRLVEQDLFFFKFLDKSTS